MNIRLFEEDMLCNLLHFIKYNCRYKNIIKHHAILDYKNFFFFILNHSVIHSFMYLKITLHFLQPYCDILIYVFCKAM